MIALVPVSDSEVRIAYLDGNKVVRYSARFYSWRVERRFKVKVYIKLFYDERGTVVKENAYIPKSIFNQMRRRAYGFFNDRVKRTKKKAAKR